MVRHLTLGILLFSAATAQAEVCVENGDARHMLFVVEAGSQRVSAQLAPGETLCSKGAGAGRVSVFAHADDVEGCTRLTRAGETQLLRRYAEFDRCAWREHSVPKP